jgi:hypothetical protein
MNDQNTIEWRKERLGRVTASRFSDVMAGPKSSAYLSYARQLRTEHLLLKRIEAGEEIPLEPDFYSAATAWGKKHEPAARAEYEWTNDCNVIVPPFTVHPDFNYAGASADGVRETSDIGLETKCPFSQDVHANTLLHGMSDDHIPQVQGGMWVYGLVAWDFVSFDPRRKDSGRYYQQRIDRNDRYIAALEKAVTEFWQFVMSGKEIPTSSGSIPVLF